jgi:uncharacterized membrane protein
MELAQDVALWRASILAYGLCFKKMLISGSFILYKSSLLTRTISGPLLVFFGDWVLEVSLSSLVENDRHKRLGLRKDG